LDITLVDPIEHGLIFERFLNPGRISMPDIDLDFRDDRRAEVLEYTARKYGDDKVAQVITFGTLGARAAIRDVGRVMDIPLNEVDQVAKLIPNIPGKPTTLAEALNNISELKSAYEATPHMRELIDTASKMEGVVRNAGTHAAGVVIADQPLLEYLPLHRPTSGAEDTPIKTVTQFEMGILESLGMLKVDFLGLATLTIMARACKMIQQRHDVYLHLGNIPTDDPETYTMLGNGNTAGVFQLEGGGMTRYLIQMKPTSLDHVIAMVALFRPGPMEFIPEYIARMHGQQPVEYRHPTLAPIFDSTYGIAVYQEQLMRAAVELAGYSPSEADDLRKAVSKKIKKDIDKHRDKFTAGASARGIPTETAKAIYGDWEEFARYGFNKSHAADYGVIAVQTAYLKVHYPVEYITALLSVSKNQTEKVALYVADARSMGIPVLPPDVNVSDWDFSIEDLPEGKATIRFGLGAIKNVGQGAVELILHARTEGTPLDDTPGKPFANLNDFTRRVDLRAVGKRTMECLIKVGALDGFGGRGAMLQSLDRIVAASASHFRAAEAGQLSLFGATTSVSEELILPPTQEIDHRTELNWERELMGLYVSDHPLTPYQKALMRLVNYFSGQLGEATQNEKVRVAGLVVTVRPYQTKAGNPMGFVSLEDIQGNIELVLFPKVWGQCHQRLETGKIILVEGKVDTQNNPPKILVDTIQTDIKLTLPDETPASEALKPVPHRVTEPPAPFEQGAEEMPPPPEAFPPGWDERVPKTQDVAEAVKMREEKQADILPLEDKTPPAAAETTEAVTEIKASADVPLGKISPILSPGEPEDREHPLSLITMLLRPSSDPERDKRRIKSIYGVLISFPGRDHFSFQIFEGGRGHLIDFPNDTTRICPEMLARLKKITSEENWRIEPITFQ
jgi:DNA polymerase-3 subunit alpha